METGLILSFTAIPIGFWLLMWSADYFVEGAAALANNLGVPPLIIGLTIVGFATSAPEMLISAFAAYEGNSGLAVGNAIGSNITNVALILGFSAIFYPMTVSSRILKKEIPILFSIMLLGTYVLFDLTLSRAEGLILIATLIILMSWIVHQGLAYPQDSLSNDSEEIPQDIKTLKAISMLLVGLAVLLASSRLLVWGAVNIAEFLGVSDLIIGLSIVALGTSLPELAATLSCAKKGQSDIAVGNVIGSNIFNILGVLGIAAIIRPVEIEPSVLYRDITTMFATLIMIVVLSLLYSLRSPTIGRYSGIILSLTYVAYQSYLGFTA